MNQWGYDILGLAGQQGAGKDFTYERLVEALPQRNVRRLGFADGVRREVTLEVFEALGIQTGKGSTDGAGQWQKPYTAGQRYLLQVWGTEFRRAQDDAYWVNYGLDYISEHAEHGDLWVITDVRFSNEAAAIHMVGGTTAEVRADADVRARRLGISTQELFERSQHASEVMDFDTQHTVWNTEVLMVASCLADWLGLDANCYPCRILIPHTFHGAYDN